VAPLERGRKKPIIINDIGLVCLEKKLKMTMGWMLTSYNNISIILLYPK
jgi:hypothetical protein